MQNLNRKKRSKRRRSRNKVAVPGQNGPCKDFYFLVPCYLLARLLLNGYGLESPHSGAFAGQECALPIHGRGKTSKCIARGNYSVARDENGDRVCATSAADGANGVGLANGCGHLPITPGLASSDLAHCSPDFLLELSAGRNVQGR